jgi:phospholipid/cholesterol/gamma-HCH transport system substrate-binding protein
MLREVKVGLLTLAAIAVLVVGIFLIGDRQQMFVRKSSYTIEFAQTGGLARGAGVQLSGVNVGQVTRVVLPEEVTDPKITVYVSIDSRYEQRIRQDSLARIKTLGLLGDKYIEISSGSPDSPLIPDGGQIPAVPATDVDQLIATGEDVAENVVAMSASLRNILERLEAGEGIFGELTAGGEEGAESRASLRSTLASIESLLAKIDSGQGSIGRLFNDDTLARRAESAIARLETTVAAFETGEGVLPALLNDTETRERFDRVLGNLDSTTAELDSLVSELREGEGLLSKLLTDEAYGAKVSADLERLIDNLNQIAEKINSGDGTAAKVVNDPAVYEALNDILVGVEESKFLSWLIRNRQKKGIEQRYEGEVERMEAEGLTPPPLEPDVDAGGAR